MNRIESRLRKPPEPSRPKLNASVKPRPAGSLLLDRNSLPPKPYIMDSTAVHNQFQASINRSVEDTMPEVAEAMFATYDTWGSLDTGATKTVIGSDFVV